MSYLIPVSEIPKDRYSFFANEMGISKTVFKTKMKTHRYINFYWQRWSNSLKVKFHAEVTGFSDKIASQSEYEDLKYNLMVIEEPEKDTKPETIKEHPEIVSKNTKVRKSIDPSLHNVLLAMNYILHVH